MSAQNIKKIHWFGLFFYLVFAVVAFCIGMPILVTAAPWKDSMVLAFIDVVALVTFICIFPLLIKKIFQGLYRFSHDSWIFYAVQVFLAGSILFALLGGEMAGSFHVFSFSLLCIILMWVLIQLPALMLTPLFLLAGISTLPMLGIVPHQFGPNYLLKIGFGQSKGMIIFIFWCACVFACVYFPRRLQFARYFLPQYRLPPKKEKNQGFTLIELLIVIAMLGIVLSGFGFGITRTMQASANYEVKTKITHILTSELDAVLSSRKAVQPAESLYPLPIALAEFEPKIALEGGFRVEQTDTETIVKISVILTQTSPGDTAKRTYRLIGFRPMGER